MTDTELNQTTQTSMKTGVPNYSVSSKTIDEASKVSDETYWTFDKWPQRLGYLKSIPEYFQAVRSLAIWTCGKGWDADAHTSVILNHISGWGEDSFDSIMQNMIMIKKANGDSFAEAIRDPDEPTGTLINLKPLNPYNIRVCVDKKGLILRYEEYDPSSKESRRKLEPWRVLHLVNDRIANEIHGTSVIESCQWVIDAKNEVMADVRRVQHRSTIRVMYIDADDTTRLTTLKTQYASAIKDGELMLIPAKKGEAEFQDLTAPPVPMEWINYLDNFFYQAVGVPRVTTGGAMDYTEASAKIGYLTFEQPYMTEQRLLEQDLQNQLGITIQFKRPVSLKDSIQSSDAANTGQTSMQPQDMQASMTRGA